MRCKISFIRLLSILSAWLLSLVAMEARAALPQSSTAPLPRSQEEVTIPHLGTVSSPEELWGGASGVDRRLTRLQRFVQRTPDDGSPASLPFTAYVGYDDRALYFLFEAEDEGADRVRATLTKRDDLLGDDAVRVYLDTFRDQQRAYVFRVNPLGVQWDAFWSEANGWDVSFDTVWSSGGELTETGYRCWMAIPWKSLRFPDTAPSGEHTFGLIVGRELQRGNGEESYWPYVSTRRQGWLNQAGTLRGVVDVSPGRNFQLIPYATARSFELLEVGPAEGNGQRAASNRSEEGQLGLDLKTVIRDRFVVDATLNPDFSQVESDAPQITVNQRFEVFFPERRPFFLENADVFSTSLNLLFTRRIADPQLGLRLTGKSGRIGLGALVIDDEAPGKSVELEDPAYGESALIDALRLSRDFGAQSRLGLFYVGRRLLSAYNHVGAIDGRWKLGERWVASGQAAWSESRSQQEEPSSDLAYTLSLSRQGRRLSYSGNLREIGRDFQADAGFVPRTGIRQTSHFLSYWSWPKDSKIIFWGPEAFTQLRWDHDGVLVDELYEGSLEWHFPDQTFVELNLGVGGTTLRPHEFPALEADRRYSQLEAVLELGSALSRRFQAQADLGWRRDVNFAPPAGLAPQPAEVLDANVTAQLRAMRRLRVDLTWLLSQVRDRRSGERAFTNDILRARANLQLSRALSLRLIVQSERLDVDPQWTALEPARRLNADLLVTYRINPWTALFAGYNGNYRGFLLPAEELFGRKAPGLSELMKDGEQVFVKLSYLIRL